MCDNIKLPDMTEKIIVSACLLGVICRYDAKMVGNQKLLNLLGQRSCKTIPVCPEVAGGLPTPRPAATIKNGDGYDLLRGAATVCDVTGRDVTQSFIEGAKKTLEVAKANNATLAILKERSPSCGVRYIYNEDVVVAGVGITTALLKKNGIKVVSDEDFVQVARNRARNHI